MVQASRMREIICKSISRDCVGANAIDGSFRQWCSFRMGNNPRAILIPDPAAFHSTDPVGLGLVCLGICLALRSVVA